MKASGMPRDVLYHVVAHLVRIQLVDNVLERATIRKYTKVNSFALEHIPEHYQDIMQLKQSVFTIFDYLLSVSAKEAEIFMDNIPYDVSYCKGLH